MSIIDYEAMSDRQLKKYFLAHREDVQAFHAYMDRRRQKQQKVSIKAGEIDSLPFSEQVRIVAERLSGQDTSG